MDATIDALGEAAEHQRWTVVNRSHTRKLISSHLSLGSTVQCSCRQEPIVERSSSVSPASVVERQNLPPSRLIAVPGRCVRRRKNVQRAAVRTTAAAQPNRDMTTAAVRSTGSAYARSSQDQQAVSTTPRFLVETLPRPSLIALRGFRLRMSLCRSTQLRRLQCTRRPAWARRPRLKSDITLVRRLDAATSFNVCIQSPWRVLHAGTPVDLPSSAWWIEECGAIQRLLQ